MFDKTVSLRASPGRLAVVVVLAALAGVTGCATAPAQPELPVYPAASNAHRGAIVQARSADGKTNWVHCVDNCPAATVKRVSTAAIYNPALKPTPAEK